MNNYGLRINNSILDSYYLELGTAHITGATHRINIPPQYQIQLNKDYIDLNESKRLEFVRKYGKNAIYLNYMPFVRIEQFDSEQFIHHCPKIEWASSGNKYILDHIQFSADRYFDITIGYGVIMADFRRLSQ
jgi:hypothetical protein